MELLLALAMAFAGDSVVVTFEVADNAAAQVVDSVGCYAEITPLGGGTIRTATVPKTAGVTVCRIAYPLSFWSPNQALGGVVGARLGNEEGGVTAWSEWTYTAADSWSYTRTVQAPAPPEADKVTVESVELN